VLSTRSVDRRKIDIKIAKTAFISVGLWILAWTPYAMLALSGVILGPTKYLSPMVSLVPSLICKVASCLNPVVYALKHPKFQRELRLRMVRIGGLFCCDCNRTTQIPSPMESMSFSPDSAVSRAAPHCSNVGIDLNALDQILKMHPRDHIAIASSEIGNHDDEASVHFEV